jgi:hypothetical protein
VDGKEESVNLNSVLIGSEEPWRLMDYYTRIFDKPPGRKATSTRGRSAPAGSPSWRTIR